jgi:hypothetical protein
MKRRRLRKLDVESNSEQEQESFAQKIGNGQVNGVNEK